MKHLVFGWLTFVWILWPVSLIAQATPGVPGTPAVPEAPAKPVSVNDTETITKSMGAEITVEGKVVNAFWVKNQVLMITFREEKEGFIAVSFAKHREVLNAAFDGDFLAGVKGKNVIITGTVTEHNYRPQMVIEKAEQIRVLPPAP